MSIHHNSHHHSHHHHNNHHGGSSSSHIHHSSSTSYLTTTQNKYNGGLSTGSFNANHPNNLSNHDNSDILNNFNSHNITITSSTGGNGKQALQPLQQQQTQQQQQQSQIQWVELEIKGFVKNLSPKLWQWTHLKYLYLNDNNLMRLPPVISSLAHLVYLDASNNKIRTLPAEIGEMTSLRELYLNNNQIRVLPYELGKLFKLIHLGLKGNPLTQDIQQIYCESNGTSKLLIHLFDQLTITCPAPARRQWMILAEPQDTRNTCIFTTMCYNVLCDKYATRQFYGYCPAWALAWDYRKKAILEDIKTYNADIITLQELETDYFYNYFLPELKQFDYDGIFSPKSRAKTMSAEDKKHVDGCAIFYKTSRFTLVKDYLVEFNQIAMATAEGSEDMINRVMTKDNIGVSALLETKSDDTFLPNGSLSNKQLILITTAHIHWDPEYCDVKLIQTLMLLNEIKQISEQATREYRPNQSPDSNIPVVICADLNSLPDSGVIEYLRTGKISANHCDFKDLGYDLYLQKMSMSDKSNDLQHNFKLECAYDKEILPFTNYTYDFKGVIDYIFYSRNSMRTLGLLGQIDPEWLKANKIVGFPHPHIPSDHLPLIVELELFIQPQQGGQGNGVSSNNVNNRNTQAITGTTSTSTTTSSSSSNNIYLNPHNIRK